LAVASRFHALFRNCHYGADDMALVGIEDLHDVAFCIRILELEDVLTWLKDGVSYLDCLVYRENGLLVPRVRLRMERADARCEGDVHKPR
jgi:hypothetical protein